MPAPTTLSGFEGVCFPCSGEDCSESNFEVKIVPKATSRRQVLPASPNLLHSVQVEGTFPNGTKLITVHDAIACENGDLQLALHGSFLPIPSIDKFPGIKEAEFPGEIIYGDGSITLNPGRKVVILKVVNTGDMPVQVGSHYHFIEMNPYLLFDQLKALGMRLNIPARTATQFEIAFYSI